MASLFVEGLTGNTFYYSGDIESLNEGLFYPFELFDVFLLVAVEDGDEISVFHFFVIDVQ